MAGFDRKYFFTASQACCKKNEIELQGKDEEAVVFKNKNCFPKEKNAALRRLKIIKTGSLNL